MILKAHTQFAPEKKTIKNTKEKKPHQYVMLMLVNFFTFGFIEVKMVRFFHINSKLYYVLVFLYGLI